MIAVIDIEKSRSNNGFSIEVKCLHQQSSHRIDCFTFIFLLNLSQQIHVTTQLYLVAIRLKHYQDPYIAAMMFDVCFFSSKSAARSVRVVT